MTRAALPDPPHGTVRRYQLRRDPCRCELCRMAWREWMAGYRARRAGRYHQQQLDPALRLDAAVFRQ